MLLLLVISIRLETAVRNVKNGLLAVSSQTLRFMLNFTNGKQTCKFGRRQQFRNTHCQMNVIVTRQIGLRTNDQLWKLSELFGLRFSYEQITYGA